MLAKVFSFSLLGIEAFPIEIEVDITRGLPTMAVVGLADTAIRESKERVKLAIKNSGFNWPAEKITVSLLPSDIKKEGTCFDLAIALGILSATQQLDGERLKEYCILGELSLDGSLRPTQGILSISIAMSTGRIKNFILPYDNAKEAAIVSNIWAWPLKTLKETVEFIHNPDLVKPFKLDLGKLFKHNSDYRIDFSEVKGQYLARRALEVAVAGGHNILMTGQ